MGWRHGGLGSRVGGIATIVGAGQTKIAEAKAGDTVALARLEGIATGDATFETEAPHWESWDAAHSAVCRLVAESADAVQNKIEAETPSDASIALAVFS